MGRRGQPKENVMSRVTALITGASAGIGEAFAEELARRGYDLVLTARREERLQALADRLSGEHDVSCQVLAADLAEPDAVEKLCAELTERSIDIGFLVNNAGYGVPGHFLNNDFSTHTDFMRVLMGALLELCHRLLPPMVERGEGHVINVASIAGMLPGTGGSTLYSAAKAFVIKFSESLSVEMADRGVKICAVCPGLTHSEFHDVTGTRNEVNQLPKFMWMSSELVAKQGVDAVLQGEPVFINGPVNHGMELLARYLPAAIARRIVGNQSKKFRSAENTSAPQKP